MDEKNESTAVVSEDEQRDEALFDAIGKDKKRKKIRGIVTAVVIVALLAGGITAAVLYGRRAVHDQIGDQTTTSVVPYTVDTGSVITTVSGSGQLADVDTEKLTVPEGVKVDKVLVAAGERVEAGTPLATVEISSVMTALSDTQNKISELDGELRGAAGDAVSANITTGVAGRVKMIYAAVGDDVAACMVENGALALLSIDGYMAVDIATDALAEGDEVTVVRTEGKDLKGTVERTVAGTATVLVTDNGPMMDEVVTVLSADGTELGAGALYIHNPLKITGYAGTVANVRVKENTYIYAGNYVFSLKDTAYSANYEAVLKQRREQEEKLLELLEIYRTGAVTAPFTGTVSSVEYKDGTQTGTDSNTNGNAGYGDMGNAGGMSGGNNGANGNGTEGNTASGETPLLTLSPDESMRVTITVDELDILSLEEGQSAQITINSIGEVFTGEVTAINKNAVSEYGVTSYTADITMPKDPRMLSGMSARVVVRIQSVAGTVLIPEDALHQSRDAAFVYTSYDPETGELTEPIPVVPGLSDGSMVEIIEGLQQGDTVYYIEVYDPWAWYYGTGGNASGGNAWIEDASDGDAFAPDGDALATDGDAGE